MPARNIHHAVVVRALTADGLTITHDPYPLSFGGKDLFVDLGAEEAALAAVRVRIRRPPPSLPTRRARPPRRARHLAPRTR